MKNNKELEETLHQWANGFSKRTEGIVTADVTANFDSDNIIGYKFLLKAPYMGSGGYSYVLFRVRVEIDKSYPVVIFNFEDPPEDDDIFNSPEETINNKAELNLKIQQIIFGPRTKRIVETLIARSSK